MQNFLLMLILGLFIATPCITKETFSLMVFGDSLSSGYGLNSKESFYAQLEKALHQKGYRNVSVINESISGSTTTDGLNRIQTAILKNPNAVLVELGGNDALRNIPIQETSQNLKQIIQTFQKQNILVLLIGMQAPPTQPEKYRSDFVAMYKDLSKKYKIPLYPFFMKGVMQIKKGSYDMTYLLDSIHPNAKGVKIMVQNILPSVISLIDKH